MAVLWVRKTVLLRHLLLHLLVVVVMHAKGSLVLLLLIVLLLRTRGNALKCAASCMRMVMSTNIIVCSHDI